MPSVPRVAGYSISLDALFDGGDSPICPEHDQPLRLGDLRTNSSVEGRGILVELNCPTEIHTIVAEFASTADGLTFCARYAERM